MRDREGVTTTYRNRVKECQALVDGILLRYRVRIFFDDEQGTRPCIHGKELLDRSTVSDFPLPEQIKPLGLLWQEGSRWDNTHGSQGCAITGFGFVVLVWRHHPREAVVFVSQMGGSIVLVTTVELQLDISNQDDIDPAWLGAAGTRSIS